MVGVVKVWGFFSPLTYKNLACMLMLMMVCVCKLLCTQVEIHVLK